MDVSNLEGTSKGGPRNPVSAFVDTMRQIKHDDANASGTAIQSTITAADNTSVPFMISKAEEQDLVKKLRKHAQDMLQKRQNKQNQQYSELITKVDDFYLLACLKARKGDVHRAYALLLNYLKWRHDSKYEEHILNIKNSKISKLLRSGIFVVTGSHSVDQRPCLIVRYKYFNPKEFAPIDVARSLGIIVEYLLRQYPNSQSHGIVVIDDMFKFSFANFDLRVFRFLEKAFTQVLPLRLAAINIVNPGWIVKTIFSLVSGFMSRKIQARINIVEAKDTKKMFKLFSPDQLPSFLNMKGTLQWGDEQQQQLVDKIETLSQSWVSQSSTSA